MWSAIFLVCSLITNQCMVQGPQKQFFKTQEECNKWAFSQMMQTDLSEVRVVPRCVGWGTPV